MACLILLWTRHVFSLLFLSERATRVCLQNQWRISAKFEEKTCFLCFSSISLVAVLYFWTTQQWFWVLKRECLGVNPDALSFFLSNFSWYLVPSLHFHGYQINNSWVPWGYSSCFSVSTAFSALAGLVARSRCSVCSGQSLLEHGFLLGKETSLWLLLWLKSCYCDTFRCSKDWLYQFIKQQLQIGQIMLNCWCCN